ncbi:FecR family protein [Flavobacterium sp.]|uniref:FecR family protein n=1 Tax=Flavobacterium sp. TaxID=239 RepID=UPI003267229F
MDENKLDEELKKIWNETPNAHSNDIKEDSWEEFRSSTFPSKKKSFVWRNYAAAAAAIIMLVGTGIYLKKDLLKSDISIASTVIENTTSKIKVVLLPDSSKVELSPNSKIELAVNFSINRKIEMDGEAYFKVKKDKKHPFQVFCKQTTATVLGTSFTVNGQVEKEVIVALYEGSVQMDVKGQNENWILKPGEKFTYANGNPTVEEFNRFTDFDNEKISDVSTYIEKNYGYKMIIPTEYNNQRITLRITKKEDLKTIIQLISEMYNLKFEVNEKVKQIIFL